MMAAKYYPSREISHIVEQRMREWEIARDQQRKAEQLRLAESNINIDYITISRELGSGGETIAGELASLLGWQLYDQEILDFMSEDMNVHKSLLESADEHTIGWVEEWLGPVFTRKAGIEQLTYYRHLIHVLMVIAKHGQAIIVGRAAGLVLPRQNGLSVRVTASLEQRVKNYARENEISEAEAFSIVEKSDRTQKSFVRSFVNQDVTDAKHYDITINTAKFTPHSAAKLIWRCLDQRPAPKDSK
ncbi:MAG: cytidylate kinase [Planctomycetes bacterium ADurb.Bin412]|nr:MAG: cytidylate kinase [Planctomycetes bacterium ADurb.Bin412]